MTFPLPTRAIPTHRTTEGNCDRSAILAVVRPGRNIDGIDALNLTTTEAAALLTASTEVLMATATDAASTEWCQDTIARLSAQGRGRYRQATQIGWCAYGIAQLAGGLDAAEGILQSLIARA